MRTADSYKVPIEHNSNLQSLQMQKIELYFIAVFNYSYIGNQQNTFVKVFWPIVSSDKKHHLKNFFRKILL